MGNHLVNETSPYLLQHQHNPVNWYPWIAEAIAIAERTGKPIFLSIGYSACHWCHVMAHESFENPQTAQLLNDHFVSIKVDREERPDLDDIYMQAVVMLTGQGGWPLSVFLTPDLTPFYGGTYFPPIPRHGLPSFNQVLSSIITTWENQPDALLKNASIITDAIQKEQAHLDQASNTIDLNQIINRLHAAYDWQHSGWGTAPKFPQPMLIEFLIQQATVSNQQALAIVEHLLENMARGGMYDLVGGGFHRYSTDAQWLIPHFEKMLYDNAQLALAYLHGYALTGEPRFRAIAEETLDFMLNEMTAPQGGFYASMDADTSEGEGRYYAWTIDELQEALSEDELDVLKQFVNLSKAGNFEKGLNVLQLKNSSSIAEKPNSMLEDIFKKLKALRAQRVSPEKDQKIITEWNAMAIKAYAEAGLFLKRPDYIQRALHGAKFLLDNLRSPEGKLYRTWRDGQTSGAGTLADYAALIIALQAVYCIDFDPEIFQYMHDLLAILQADFSSHDYLYFDTSVDVANLIVRPRNLQDNATPSGNALAAYTHWLFANYEHDLPQLERARQMVNQTGQNLQHYPTSFGHWLQVAGLLEREARQIALISPERFGSLEPFLTSYHSSHRPFDIIAARFAGIGPDDQMPAILHARPDIDAKPTAYICQGFVCQAPITELDRFKEQLDNPS